jgi:hypothetical protein
MEIPTIHVFTHDSIGVGEDGLTHQPVEDLVSLRAIASLLVFRPADANEVAETWRIVTALKREPAVLILSRQALPTVDRSVMALASGVAQGAYVLAEAEGGNPEGGDAGRVREGRGRRRRARSQAPIQCRDRLRRRMERPDGSHRRTERGAPRLTPDALIRRYRSMR